jgi:ATP-binding cassette subfamily B protein
VNLKIAKGEKLAVVGRNGAGKTTLVKLLCGFYDPTEGEVLLNGQDIRQYDRRAYYRLFSAVFQDFSLLPGSIALNVAQSLDEIDMEKVKDCVRRAGLAEKIEALPQVYETKLGKSVYLDALELSGGETQRLMLARALYKEGAVIVLDEPTAALDPLAERDLYNRYHELTKGATSVYVSHRLASTRFCDRIILIGDGGIAEVGTHETLLAAGGEYAHLFEVQSQYYREGGDSDGE